ncbi:MAG: hypothetical protein Q7J67_06100 [bacterium]|nr:hypothetical protein [bacterium]
MKCPICKKIADYTKEAGDIIVDCHRCGEFFTNQELINNIDFFLKELKKESYILSAILREINVFSGINDELPRLYPVDIKGFFDLHKVPETVSEKIDKFLLYLEKRSDFLGNDVTISFENDYPIVYVSRSEEIRYLLNLLGDLQYVILGPEVNSGLVKGCFIKCRIDIAGWKRLEEIKKINPDSKICFTAMSFEKEDEPIFKKGIKPGAKLAGYDAKRSDMVEHNDMIMDKIINLIKQSKFIIADFTNSNKKGGIYYEAGFAKGLGLPVIFTCKESYFKEDKGDKIHFDIKQENHILWKNTEDLKKRLGERIKNTILFYGNLQKR